MEGEEFAVPASPAAEKASSVRMHLHVYLRCPSVNRGDDDEGVNGAGGRAKIELRPLEDGPPGALIPGDTPAQGRCNLDVQQGCQPGIVHDSRPQVLIDISHCATPVADSDR